MGMDIGPPDGSGRPETIAVQFQNGPQWDMPVTMARQVLQDFAAENPQLFGRLIRRAIVGEAST